MTAASVDRRRRRTVGATACSRARKQTCAGLECLAGIPGTVGGTPVQNVGAYGQEVSSVIERVRVFDAEERRFAELTADECGFSYRRSRFNSEDRGRFIVMRVDYRLREGGAPTLRYPDVQKYFKRRGRGEPSLGVKSPQQCEKSGSRKACSWLKAIPIAAAREASSRIRW